MKRFLTFCCALLGFGAMASADYSPAVDEQGYLDISGLNAGNIGYGESSATYNETSRVLTITYPGEYYKEKEEWESGTLYSWDDGEHQYVEDNYGTFLKHDGTYECFGWGFWAEAYVPTGYTNLAVTLEGTFDEWAQLQVEPASGSSVSANGTFDADGKLTLDVELNEYCLAGITQIYIQNGTAEQVIKVISVQFYDATVGNESEEEPEVTGATVWTFDDEVWEEWQIAATENSENKYWPNYLSDGTEVNGLTFTVGGGNLYFQTNSASCKVGENDEGEAILYTPAYRVQLGGSGSITTGSEKNLIGVPVEGACTIYVVAAAAGSNKDRYLKASAGQTALDPTDGYLTSYSSEDNNCLFSFEYTGTEATTIYLYSSNSGINIFAIAVKDIEVEEAEPEPTEIEGYLTVTVGDTDVTTNEAVKITVTEGEGSEMTVAIDELEISNSITLSDVAVVFTPEANGEYTIGTVSGTVTVAGSFTTSLSDDTATGTYVVDEDTGDVTFTAEFSYSSLTIAVSFTTVEPVVEEWTIIANEENYVTDETKWVGDGNYQLTFTFEELKDYEYIKIVGTTKTSADDDTDSETYESWTDWGAIELDERWTVFGEKFSYDYTTANQEPIIASIAEIQAACADDATEFYIALWGNTISVTVYASADYDPEAEAGTEEADEEDPIADWQLELVAYGIGWGGSYAGIYTSEQVDGVITNSATIAELIAVETNPTSVADLGGVVVKLGGVVADQIVDYTITCTGASIAVEGQAVVGSTNYQIDEWGYITLGQFDTPAVHEQNGGIYTFSETDVFTATVELGTAGIDTGIASVTSDVEAIEVARYNLMGQKISGAEKGINIIVYSDGSAKKVLVK